jgi:hypothetical protein
VRKGEEGGRK